MPTIAVFYGIMIRMYWRDHAPPHLHAIYQGYEALIAIESGEVIGGHLPPNALKFFSNGSVCGMTSLWQIGSGDGGASLLNRSLVPSNRR